MVIEIGKNDPTQWLTKIFSKADADGNGEISQTEFKDTFSKLLAEKMGGKNDNFDISKLFSMIDTDQDGNISKDELADFIEKSKKAPPPPPIMNPLESLLKNPDLFNEIDANGDGVISQQELINYIEKNAKPAETTNVNQNLTDGNTVG